VKFIGLMYKCPIGIKLNLGNINNLMKFYQFAQLLCLFVLFENLNSKSSLQVTSNLNISNNCEYKLTNDKYYNLLPLRNPVDYHFNYRKYIYKANFCGPLVTNHCAPNIDVPASVDLKSNT